MSLFRPPRRSDNDNDNPFRYKAEGLRFMWTSAILVLCLILGCIAVGAIIMAF